MFLAVKYCRKNESLSSIAKRFGIKISALNMARGRFQQLLKRDKELMLLCVDVPLLIIEVIKNNYDIIRTREMWVK